VRFIPQTSLALALVVASTLAAASGKNYDVKIDGMHCAACVKSVRAALAKLPDVEPGSVVVTLKTNNAVLAIKEGKEVPKDAIEKAIEKAGYSVTAIQALK
jgi:copper chaperone CopZ